MYNGNPYPNNDLKKLLGRYVNNNPNDLICYNKGLGFDFRLWKANRE